MGVVRFRTRDAIGNLLGSVAVATALVLAINHDQAQAHGADTGWTYPPACCGGDPIEGDCQRIPYAAVKTRLNGFVVTLYPGDHCQITRRQTFLIPYGNEIASGERDYHICLHPTKRDANCFFAPPDGA